MKVTALLCVCGFVRACDIQRYTHVMCTYMHVYKPLCTCHTLNTCFFQHADFTDHNFKCLKQYDPNSVRYSISVVWSIPASVAAAVNQYTFGASLRGNDDGSIAILQPPKAFSHSVMEVSCCEYSLVNSVHRMVCEEIIAEFLLNANGK